MSSRVKIIVFVPESHADILRQAMGDAGAGLIGNYSHCSFTTKGLGRFLPLPGADPHIGTVGAGESVEEERIETICTRDRLDEVLAAIRRVHPYDEVALDVFPTEDVVMPKRQT